MCFLISPAASMPVMSPVIMMSINARSGLCFLASSMALSPLSAVATTLYPSLFKHRSMSLRTMLSSSVTKMSMAMVLNLRCEWFTARRNVTWLE